MALRYITSSGNTSTVTGLRCEAQNLIFDPASGTAVDDASTTRTIPVTFATNCNAQGIMFFIRAAYGTGTLTIKLQEYVTGAWTDRVTLTKNFDATDIPCRYGIQYFAMTPYAVTTAASTWRYTITASTSNRLWLWRDATAGNWFYAVPGDADTNTISTNDAVIVGRGATLTFNSTVTLAKVNSYSLCLEGGSKCAWAIGTTPYTLTTGNAPILMSFGTEFRIGEDGNEIPVAGKAKIDVGSATSMFVGPRMSSTLLVPADATEYIDFYFYGEPYEYISAHLSSEAAASQAELNVVEDRSSAWAASDSLYLVGSTGTSLETDTYQIHGTTAITATKITLSANLSKKHFKNSTIVNTTKAIANLPIEFTGSAATSSFVLSTHVFSAGAQVFQGIYFNGMTLQGPNTGGYAFGAMYINSCYIYAIGSGRVNNFYSYVSGMTVNNCHMYYNSQSTSGGTYIYGKNVTVSDVSVKNAISINSIQIINSTFSRYVYRGSAYTTYGGYNAAAVKCTYTDCLFSGCYYSLGNAMSKCTFTRCVIESAGTYAIYCSSFIDNTFNYCDVGRSTASGTSDIYFVADTFSTLIFNNSYFYTVDASISGAVPGSYVRSLNHLETADDYRSWYTTGNFVSDTSTIEARTNSTSSTLENVYNASTGAVEDIPIRVAVTSNIVSSNYYGGTHTNPTVTVNYDGGTTATASGTDTISAETISVPFTPTLSNQPLIITLSQKSDAADIADREVAWYDLNITMRPYGYQQYYVNKEIVRTTDDIIFDVIPGSVDPIITETTAATVAGYDGITITHGATDTIVLDGTGATPVTTSAMLYDYCQYNLGLEANLGEAAFYYSVDGGISFTSAYDMTIDGVTITATDKTLRMGSNTLTLSNEGIWTGVIDSAITITDPGTYDINIGSEAVTFTTAGTYDLSGGDISGTIELINTSGGAVTVMLASGVTYTNTGPNITIDTPLTTQSCTISGAVAGSLIQVYDTESDTELYIGNPTFPYTWTDPDPYVADRTFRVRVMYVDGATAKQFIDATVGTATNASPAVSYLVTQVDDDVYNTNAIDGSAVTDVSIVDGTLRCEVATGTITWAELYAYETYWLFTEAGMQDEGRFTYAPDTANYIWTDFKIKNVTDPSVPLVITGGYGRDSATGTSLGMIDTTGGTVIMAPDHVVAYATGSALTTEEHNWLSDVKTKSDYIPNKTVASKIDIIALN